MSEVIYNRTAFENCTGCLKIIPFHEPCRTLEGLSKMVLANVIIFAVLKKLDNPLSIQKYLFADNC